MKKNFRTWFAALTMLCMSTAVGAQTIGGSSPLWLDELGGRIGMSLQPGVASDADTLWTLKGDEMFTIYFGTLAANSGTDFDGYIAAVLVRGGNQLVDVLCEQRLIYSYMVSNTPFTCRADADVEVKEGDVIRLATRLKNSDAYSFVNSPYPGMVTSIPATDYRIPFYEINMPTSVPGAHVRVGDTQVYTDKAVRGRNFIFYVEPEDSTHLVVVKANGVTIAPSNTMYTIGYVLENYDVSIKIYDPDTVCPYHKVTVSESIRLADLLTQDEMDCTSYLTVEGDMKDEDFYTIRDRFPFLRILNLENANAENNTMPDSAFMGNRTIRRLALPLTLEVCKNNCFYSMQQLDSIVLPSKLSVFGYNEFLGSTRLTTVWVKWNPLENNYQYGFPVPACAFRATPYDYNGTLIVPKGCKNAYKQTSVWGSFKTIREEYPVDKIRFALPAPPENPVIPEDPEAAIDAVGSADVTLGIAGGCCVVRQPGNELLHIVVTALNGQALFDFATTECETRLALMPGVYVVQINGRGEKIVMP